MINTKENEGWVKSTRLNSAQCQLELSLAIMFLLRIFGKCLKMSLMQLLRIKNYNVAVKNLARLCWERGYWQCWGVIWQHNEGSWVWWVGGDTVIG